jgi:hypothetical protein
MFFCPLLHGGHSGNAEQRLKNGTGLSSVPSWNFEPMFFVHCCVAGIAETPNSDLWSCPGGRGGAQLSAKDTGILLSNAISTSTQFGR